MRLPVLFVIGITLGLASATTGGDAKAPEPPKESYVKVRVEVEVRGVLGQASWDITVSSRFRVYELFNDAKEIREGGGEGAADVYTLDFARAKGLRELAVALKGKEVVVTGMSELRMVDRPRRSGGGSGPGTGPPAPTWSLQRTILVTGLTSAKEQ